MDYAEAGAKPQDLRFFALKNKKFRPAKVERGGSAGK
jgi:hypothetical protein